LVSLPPAGQGRACSAPGSRDLRFFVALTEQRGHAVCAVIAYLKSRDCEHTTATQQDRASRPGYPAGREACKSRGRAVRAGRRRAAGPGPAGAVGQSV